MAKKQGDYLAGLLADDREAATATAQDLSGPAASHLPAVDRASSRAGLSLLGRENALARVANGEVRQITQLLLDPARVRVWSGNARVQGQLSETNCRDLIDSFVAEGGQKIPAVVRRIDADPAHDYELIAGTRRHFAVSWLRANSYPEIRLLAQVADLDDEAAFRLADIENRARKDISDIERARNYAAALGSHYGDRAVRMAERLKLSKGWLSKMLKAATIPDGVLAAFADWRELTLNPAYKLAIALDDKARSKAIQAEARSIVAENAKQISSGAPAILGSHVLARLLAATAVSTPLAKAFNFEVRGSHGRPIVVVKGVNRQGVTLHLPNASGADDDQIADAIRKVMEALREDGITVQ